MYAIVGATGNTGSVVANELLDAGEPVRVFVRSEEKGRPFKERGAEVAIVDVHDETSLRAGFEGVSGAYIMWPPDMTSADMLAERASITEKFTAALSAAGVKHAVVLSSIAAQHPEGTGVIRSAHQAEQRFRIADVASTFVRAAYFMENWGAVAEVVKGSGVLPQMIGSAERAIPMVATRDIGKVAAAALREGPASAGIIELEGPARYSPNDVAAAVRTSLGRDIGVIDIPLEAQVEQFTAMGIGENVAELYREMHGGIASGHVDFEGGDVRHVKGETGIDQIAKLLFA